MDKQALWRKAQPSLHGVVLRTVGVYALFAGLVFLMVVGIVFAPIVHRILHVFHLEPSPLL